MPINHQTTITLNGVPQYVSIRAERDHLPLLLYLHGGPGDQGSDESLEHSWL